MATAELTFKTLSQGATPAAPGGPEPKVPKTKGGGRKARSDWRKNDAVLVAVGELLPHAGLTACHQVSCRACAPV